MLMHLAKTGYFNITNGNHADVIESQYFNIGQTAS